MCMKKERNGLLGKLGKFEKFEKAGKPGGFGRLRTAVAVLCLGLYIILCGVGGSGFVSPAMAGENGTLLWWGRLDVLWEDIDEVRNQAQEAKVDLIINEDEETLAQFLAGQNISGLDAPVILYWVPNHGSGWKNAGGYTLNEVSAMVQEAVGVLGGAKLDVTLLGSCYAGNIETMSCFAGLTERVLGNSEQATVMMAKRWLEWLIESPGVAADFERYHQEEIISFYSFGGRCGGPKEQLANPDKLLEILREIRSKNVSTAFFRTLPRHDNFSDQANDIWGLAEFCGVTGLLREAANLIVLPENRCWDGYCLLSCWNGEDEDLYISTVPEANRCIPGSSVTPDPATPTPVPGNAGASGGGGGCLVGAHNFPALLLLIPLTVVMMKKGKK